MTVFFVFFFLSGFCGLVYQVVWLRIAMADFGVTTPLISIVLSVFMAGLALGSWAGGRLVRRLENRPAAFFVRLYGIAELTIGISGLVVVGLLRWGRVLLVGQWGFSAEDAFMFLSVAGDLGLAQYCHPSPGSVIARMRVPKIAAVPGPFRR